MKLFLTIGILIPVAIPLFWLLCLLWQLWRYRGAVEMANTVPLEHCRQILGKDIGLSDGELELLRDQVYGLARVAVEGCILQRRGNGAKQAPAAAGRAIGGAAREPSS